MGALALPPGLLLGAAGRRLLRRHDQPNEHVTEDTPMVGSLSCAWPSPGSVLEEHLGIGIKDKGDEVENQKNYAIFTLFLAHGITFANQ